MNKIKQHLLPLFIILLVSIFSWNFVFEKLNEPKNYEKINIFVTGTVVDKNLTKNLKNELGIKEVFAYEVMPNNEYYGTMLQTNGIMSSDLLIFDNEILLDDGSTHSFVEFSDELINNYELPNDITYSIVDGKKFGIIVYDKQNSINLLENKMYFDENTVYVLVINKDSVNVSPYGFEENITDNALKALKLLLD